MCVFQYVCVFFQGVKLNHLLEAIKIILTLDGIRACLKVQAIIQDTRHKVVEMACHHFNSSAGYVVFE